MKRFALIVSLCISALCGLAQESHYDKSIRLYREHKLDSAQQAVDAAIIVYRQQHKQDSLVFSYTQKSLIEWDLDGIQKGITVIDTAIRLATQLPAKSSARVAAHSRLGQLYTRQFELKEAARQFSIAQKAVDSTQPPNRHYVALYNQVATMHLMAEQYPLARQNAQKSYDLNVLVEGKDGVSMPGIIQTLYYISNYSDQLQQALQYGIELQRLVTLHYAPGHAMFGTMHNSLAIIYESLQQYEDALYHRQQAVDIHFKNYQKSKSSYSLAAAYHNLGLLYGYIHEGYLSAEYLRKGSRLLALTYGEDGAGMVNILVDLAVNKQQAKAWSEAEKLFQQALALQQKHDPANWASLAYVESFFGDLYLDQQQYPKAAELYQTAISHYDKAGTGDSKTALLTKEALAKTFSGTHQLEKALALQQQVLVKFREIYPAGHDAIAGILQGISEAWFDAGKLPEALAYSDQVFTTLLQTPTLPGQLRSWFAKLPFSYHTALYVSHRVRVLQSLYQKTGNRQFLEQLLLLCDQYSDFIAGNLHLFRTQATLIELAEVNKNIYADAIEACWSLSSAGKDRALLVRAFGYSERSKALLLRLAANNMLVDAQKAHVDPVAQKDRAFRQQVSTLNLQYLQADHKDSLLPLLTGKMEQYRLFQDSLKKSGNAILSSRQDLSTYSLAEIRAALLQHKQTLIEYAVTDQSLFTFVLSADTFHVQHTSRKVLADIAHLKELHGLNPRTFAAPTFRLYQALIKPVEPLFASNRLLIIPDADLYYLNFELLITSGEETTFSRMPYLIRQYNLSYLLSAASAMQFKQAQHAARKNKALLFTPVFTDAMKASYSKSQAVFPEEASTYQYLYRQPFTLQAATQIGQYVSGDLFAEQQAGEHAFKKAAPDYRILHLGTHAEVNDQAPLQSRLFFAKALPGDTLDTDDGYLYTYEIYAMQLRAELAVLTACETGGGVYHQGEGVISLAHSFMYAGCPSVVMSLWKIDDKTSAGIITEFYRLLSLGKSKSEALRIAKLQYLDKSSTSLAHPYYWAGLALIGDDAPVYSNPYPWLWYLASIALLVGAGYWVFRRVRL